MFEIIPGILEKEWKAIEERIRILSPLSKTIHIDVLDGKFADNTTFLDPAPFSKYSKDIFFEVHFMTEEPIKYLKPFADAGFKRFIGQVEKMSDQAEFIAQGQMLGEVGLAIDKETPLSDIKVPLTDLDTFLVMSIKAGFSGQTFIEELLKKTKEASEKTPNPIEVDGGINDATILIAASQGVRRFVTTSYLFSMGTPKEQYELLKKKLESLELSSEK